MASFEWTNSLKKQITEDWKKAFPGYKIYKNLWLVKKIDCMVLGILLKTSSKFDTDYEVIFHLHNLLKPFPVLSLEVNFDLQNSETLLKSPISVFNHSKIYINAAEKLKEQNPIITREKDFFLELEEIYTNQLKNYLKVGRSHPANLMESFLMIKGYYGVPDSEIYKTLSWFEWLINSNELGNRFFESKLSPQFQKENVLVHLTNLANSITKKTINYEGIIKGNCEKLKILC